MPIDTLAPYLDTGARIYAQGSRAIGATIVHGADDDRFDLDAILEFPKPYEWTPGRVLDTLFDALKGFPDAKGIERCTRCVQLQFAFMHLDVTPMDPAAEPRPERVGDIFHSPDDGKDEVYLGNPYGFANWFRRTVSPPSRSLVEQASMIRKNLVLKDRLDPDRRIYADADLDKLPDENPVRYSPQVIALKLMKRFLNLREAGRDGTPRRPPSVYLSKIAAEQPPNTRGLLAQFQAYARDLEQRMAVALNFGPWPDERNPVLACERLNDRWPRNRDDMRTFHGDLQHLREELERIHQGASISEIRQILDGLFGEKISQNALETYLRIEQATSGKSAYQHGQGYVGGAAAGLTAPSAKVSVAKPHHFHPGKLEK
jgi:hypothetical protein